LDSTPSFFQELGIAKKKRDGTIIGIRGPRGIGKSILAQMVLTHLVDTTPHILFRHRDARTHLEKYVSNKKALGLGIDEDLRATGDNSRNVMVNLNNAYETGRKAELNVTTTGVNLSFEGWGETLDLRLEPWGYNETFQATRFAFYDVEDELLGLAALQRKFTPETLFQYYDDIGTAGQYKARAKAYSYEVMKLGGTEDAIAPEVQTHHIETLKAFLQKERLDRGLEIPPADLCKRFYRQAHLPNITSGYMKEIIEWAVEELEEQALSGMPIANPERSRVVIGDSKGWAVLRKILATETSDEFAAYHVPNVPLEGYSDVVRRLELGILADSFGTNMRRHRQTLDPSRIGRLGELAVFSWLNDPSGVARLGSGHSDSPDVLLSLSSEDAEGTGGPSTPAGPSAGLENTQEIALNVKLTLKDDFKERLEVTPEDQWAPFAFAVLLVPRRLSIKVYSITGPEMTLNSGAGSLATPESLRGTIERMITAASAKR
jgi:hypothetical protein